MNQDVDRPGAPWVGQAKTRGRNQHGEEGGWSNVFGCGAQRELEREGEKVRGGDLPGWQRGRWISRLFPVLLPALFQLTEMKWLEIKFDVTVHLLEFPFPKSDLDLIFSLDFVYSKPLTSNWNFSYMPTYKEKRLLDATSKPVSETTSRSKWKHGSRNLPASFLPCLSGSYLPYIRDTDLENIRHLTYLFGIIDQSSLVWSATETNWCLQWPQWLSAQVI